MNKVLNLNDIRNILPQRSPMLMLDRAEQISENVWHGLKNLTMNELFFQGHFPVQPIMPGVLQVEAMKQLGELAVRGILDPGGKRDVYMKLVEKVKFRRPNNPGDRAMITVEVQECSAESATFKGKVENRSGVTCEAVITLAVRDRDYPAEMPALYNEFDKGPDNTMDLAAVLKLMPHRYPFLFIDYIAKVEGEHVMAVKNITGNEEFFSHGQSIALPEAILCEIVAQSGCACVLSRPENAGKLGYFMSIDRAESFAPVTPGDQLVIDIVLPPGKSKFGKGSGVVRVEGKTVFEITLMFAIVDA
ncbi:MAG: 3-hydroxyacyl-ACP dehydratase FabZ [Victivallaceae bacterium]|nr:3-hydroxyacyl-ACP dehydratase FabZ [Victivallaceae bacterium]